ncbi:hypothetical protein Tco_1451007 [Tanacetum coccineum]
MASATSRLDRDPWIEDLNATSSLSYLSKLLSTLFPGGASLNAAGPASSWSNRSVDLNVSVAMYDYVFICVCVGYVRLDNQSIEHDRLIGIGFVLNFVKFISFTFGDKEMISVIEAVSR